MATSSTPPDPAPGWDDEEEAPRELTPEEQALHQENMAKLGRIMRAYTILKIGLSALLIVVVVKLFGR
ncbi:hypothetical protein PbB2_01921 [Candidatus Phycosocius bacilliformis]|uniref:Uncharacterized protein n=1 Tax=Candidatus Phycosocius bacilliformis TaxID=1445552 RepID=A0A2P2EB40_9PROT|nr:hypothetical protein [Candidatus Phycosocius bacilliformis]GBF58249.1 hypothetical protein PbB2_01921 [Candidatus Phycosocius bacilliformis]